LVAKKSISARFTDFWMTIPIAISMKTLNLHQRRKSLITIHELFIIVYVYHDMCKRICVNICIYIRIYMYMCMCIYIHICTCNMYMCMCIYIHICTCIYSYTFIHIYTHSCIYMYTYVYLCIYIYIYICMYMYIWWWWSPFIIALRSWK